jgi:hypothetical protein
VIRKRLGRVATVSTAATMALMLLGVGSATAATAPWEFLSPVNLPLTVSPSTDTKSFYAAWSFTIHNKGTSNIAQLYLTDSRAGAAAFVSATRAGCVTSPELYCNFGALNAGQSIDVVVAYKTPTTAGNFPITFQLNANGSTFSDGRNKSRGDTLNLPFDGGTNNPPVTVVSGSSDFSGGYALDGASSFETSTSLTKNNPQSTSATTPTSNTTVMVLETSGYTGGTDPLCGGNVTCIGQWTTLTAPAASPTNPIKVVLTILKKGLPGSIGPDDLSVYHDGDGIISTHCASANDSASAPCIYPTEVGGNLQIVVWLDHNGGLRGIY